MSTEKHYSNADYVELNVSIVDEDPLYQQQDYDKEESALLPNNDSQDDFIVYDDKTTMKQQHSLTRQVIANRLHVLLKILISSLFVGTSFTNNFCHWPCIRWRTNGRISGTYN